MKKYDYVLVERTSPEKLIASVEARFTEGWRCQGGVCYTRINGVNHYIQAMIKKRVLT